MKQFTAVVSHDAGLITKYQDFDTQAEADAHVVAYGGKVVEGLDHELKYWDVSGATPVKDTSAQDADTLTSSRERRYNEADVEYVKRSLIAAEAASVGSGKVRGGNPKDRLIAIGVKANAKGQNALKAALADVHDKLDALKDAIEVGDQVYLDGLDVTDNVHWS